MEIRVKKLNEKAIIPTKGSEYAAGMDLYACTETSIVISPHTTVKIGTGLAIELPHGYFGALVARSGLATNQGLRIAQGMAVIDEDYRGEWIVPLHNDGDVPQMINPMERICQLVVMPYLGFDFVEVNGLSETKRGNGGFGHSGKF